MAASGLLWVWLETLVVDIVHLRRVVHHLLIYDAVEFVCIDVVFFLWPTARNTDGAKPVTAH